MNIFPSGVFWKDTDSIFIGCDRQFALLAGFRSQKDIIGKTDFDLPWGGAQATKYRKDDNTVIYEGESKLNIEEKFILIDGSELSVLTSKTPLLSPAGKIMGVFGFFYDTTENENSLPDADFNGTGIPTSSTILSTLAESFFALINPGLSAIQQQIDSEYNDQSVQLGKKHNVEYISDLAKKISLKYSQFISIREAECLFYLIRGKSARETGVILHLSQRTVEFYLNSLKDKLNCRKKSELIDNVYNFF